jgi:hypothetical protein
MATMKIIDAILFLWRAALWRAARGAEMDKKTAFVVDIRGNWFDISWEGFEGGREVWLSFDRTKTPDFVFALIHECLLHEDIQGLMDLWDNYS